MRLVIRGSHLPGLSCGPYANVHIGLQVKGDPTGLVPADAPAAEWLVEIATEDGDFHGPAVHGKRGQRFVYLTWGTVDGKGFTMFRRAKLMLADLLPAAEEVRVDIDLTDEHGMPRCARLRPPAIRIG
jgi:hypothetical protein